VAAEIRTGYSSTNPAVAQSKLYHDHKPASFSVLNLVFESSSSSLGLFWGGSVFPSVEILASYRSSRTKQIHNDPFEAVNDVVYT
jgi:hypothetical protein